jgi:tetratricopeptide (TPR) repeat protein
MVLVPLAVFGMAELVLRLIGYGYHTSFFLRTNIKGREYFVPNPEFTYRFFSAGQARPSLPIRVAAEKPAGVYRIFLFGESAANGDPDPTYGVGRYLEVLLRERFPKTDFEVLCVAITGIDSHTILPIARECAWHHGDAWVIYMGNNEMVGPFGAETVFGARAPSLGIARASLAAKRTRLGQLLDGLATKLRGRSPSPDSWGGMQIGLRGNPSTASSPSGKFWGGMQMFSENRLRHDDPARLRVYENFRGNLEDMLTTGCRAGVPVILSTVAVNLRDCPPFASLHRPGLDGAREASWAKAYEEGQGLEAAGAHGAALASYQKAAGIDSQYADLQFQMGQCHLAMTNDEQALRDFELARDYDALAFRTDSTLNEAIRAAAGRRAGQGVYLVDAAQTFGQRSPAKIPGLNLFYEHVHLNFAGNYLLALNFAEQLRKVLPAPITGGDQGKWASADRCDRRLAVTVWDRQRVWQPIFNRISAPPFTGQLNHEVLFKLCERKLAEAKEQMNFQTPEEARRMYEEALALAPEDNLLHGNFEQFLEAAGDLPGATREAQRICELVPHLAASFYYTGTLLVRQGRTSEAEDYFGRAVAIKGDYPQAHNELGLIYVGQKKSDIAVTCFKRALGADRGFADAYINLGLLEEREGKPELATGNYEKAAALQPEGPADYFNRAVKLVWAGRSTEGIECFRVLVQQLPTFWQAHYRLGVELAAAGKSEEAQAQFAAVLRYRPDYAEVLPPGMGPAGGSNKAGPDSHATR